MTDFENSDEIINEIAEGGTKKLRQLGLNKKNIDNLLGSNNLIQVRTTVGKPFLRTIRNPTPLVYAILCEQLDTVLYLILHLHSSFEKSEFFISYFHNTPLHFATRGSNLLIVQALIACGAKIGIQNNSKETPLSSAKQSRHQEIKDYLIGISTRKIKRPSLDDLVKKYLPILDGEEEEEEDKTVERNDKLNESNSNDINISKDLGKGSKQLSAIYQSLKEIDNKINTVKDSVQIVELNSKKYPDTSNITPINEEDSHLNNLCKYINDLSGKINYLEHTLNIDIEEDEEEEENNNEDQKEKNKDDDTKKQSKDGKKSKKIKGKEDIYDKEPLQEEVKSSFPFFKSSNKCYYCGSQICHFCSKCRHFVCLVCTNSILHIDDDVE